jgi:hypothetical protein
VTEASGVTLTIALENRGADDLRLIAPGVGFEAEQPSEFAAAMPDFGFQPIATHCDTRPGGVDLPPGTIAYRGFDLVLADPSLLRLSGVVRVSWQEVSLRSPPLAWNDLGYKVPASGAVMGACRFVELALEGNTCQLERDQALPCSRAPDLTLDVTRSYPIAPP